MTTEDPSQQFIFGEHEVFGHGVFKDYRYFSVVKTGLSLFREHVIFVLFRLYMSDGYDHILFQIPLRFYIHAI